MMYINQNVLTSIIANFCRRHSDVNDVLVSNEIDFYATPNLNYPVVNIEPVEANLDGNFISQGFVITVADIMDTEFIGENNFRLIDGCQRIAGDITLYLQNQEDFDASANVTFNSFEDEGTDRTAGVVFRINLVYMRDDSTCILDDVADLAVNFRVDVDNRLVHFNKWLLHPYNDEYEITLDGGLTWQPMISNSYRLVDTEIPANTIGQRLKPSVTPFMNIIWNANVIPAKTEVV